ncbi:MAG: acyltransferase [Kiritimatiellia bacterium]
MQIAKAILKIKAKTLSFAYGIALPVRYRGSWLLRGRPLIIKRRQSTITIGKRWTACSLPKYNSIGVIQRVFIRTCEHDAMVRIGDDVGMSGCTISAHKSITIGNHVLIGSGALITDPDAHSLDATARRTGAGGEARSVVIEDDVFVGARAIILKGVRLGRGVIVGAGAVVSKSVPEHCIVAGNPAKVVRRVVETSE